MSLRLPVRSPVGPTPGHYLGGELSTSPAIHRPSGHDLTTSGPSRSNQSRSNPSHINP